jgi:DNA-binding transcriptional regulator WhiA
VFLLVLQKAIIAPISSSLRSLDKEITDKEAQIKNDINLISHKDRIQSETKTYLSYVTAPATEEEATTALLKDLEVVANKAGVYLVDIKPAGSKEIEEAKKYLITLTCEGKMEQITDFLYAIESSAKLLKVERYQISPKSKDSTSAQANMTVSQAVLPQ